MGKRILVPIDGSPQSEAALEFVLEEFPAAEVVLLHVIDPIEGGTKIRSGIPVSSEEWFETAKAEAEELLEAARERASDRDVPIETEIEVGRPARVIVELADEDDVDQIVMGSHGRSGVSRILLGSVTEQVVRRSTVPVTVVR